MKPAALLLVVLLILGVAVALFLLLRPGASPPPSPPGAAATQVSDAAWEAMGVYPQRQDGDPGGHLAAMMRSNAGFGDRGQWSTQHYAFLFYPGVNYTHTVQVGFLTTVHGMGAAPGDVSLPLLCLGDSGKGDTSKGAVGKGTGALNNFWRSAENLEMLAPTTCPEAFDPGTCALTSGGIQPLVPCPWAVALTKPTWAASQASALRRVKAQDLQLDYVPSYLSNGGCTTDKAAFASGGFAGDCDLTGAVAFMGQQQYAFVAASFDKAPTSGAWNFVYAGCAGPAATERCAQVPLVATVPQLPRSRAKPFLAWSPDARPDYYSVYFDPQVTLGATGPRPAGQPHGFARASDEAGLRQALAGGAKVIVLASPGDVAITQELVISGDGVTLLGLGMPTLLLGAGVRVTGSGCALCGLVLECRAHLQDLLSWESTEAPGASGLLADCAFRVGGAADPTSLSCTAMCRLRRGCDVLLENCWMWRADHGSPAYGTTGRYLNGSYMNDCKTGLWVEAGARATAYGLACEHSTDINCRWEGDGGRLYFYQCELPYCVAEGWDQPGLQVTGADFEGIGLGVYCYFPDAVWCQGAPVPRPAVTAGIVVPAAARVRNALTVWLNGTPGQGTITHVARCGEELRGGAVTSPEDMTATLCKC